VLVLMMLTTAAAAATAATTGPAATAALTLHIVVSVVHSNSVRASANRNATR
jgi:hypothetical protein